jgi:hypothetical protein
MVNSRRKKGGNSGGIEIFQNVIFLFEISRNVVSIFAPSQYAEYKRKHLKYNIFKKKLNLLRLREGKIMHFRVRNLPHDSKGAKFKHFDIFMCFRL